MQTDKPMENQQTDEQPTISRPMYITGVVFLSAVILIELIIAFIKF